MEGLLEQQCILNILDHQYVSSDSDEPVSPRTGSPGKASCDGEFRKAWFVFNMGGSDCRVFSRFFKAEFPQKGAKFAAKPGACKPAQPHMPLYI